MDEYHGRPVIFLDRDGIVNKAVVENGIPYPPHSTVGAYPTEGIKELVYSWKKFGYMVIVITNQPDVGNRITSKNRVDKITRHLQAIVGFDDFFTCYHGQKENCDCRKPKTGLFKQAHEKYNIDFSNSYMIGDRWSDIEAGRNAGCVLNIFVDNDYGHGKPLKGDNIITVKTLLDIKNEQIIPGYYTGWRYWDR